MALLCIREDACKSWEKSGKNEFLRLCHNLLSSQKKAVEVTGEKDLKRAFYELCWLGVRGQLKTDLVVMTISEMAQDGPDVLSLVADLFSVIDVELSCLEDACDRERFISLVNACQQLIPDFILKERLDAETLENMGLVQSKALFQQKYVKTKTKLYYKQQKFNLLREESEGYSKLITELNQDFPENMTHLTVLQNIKSLIGCFNLDPNRVLDIILESFECRPEKVSMFVPLLTEYTADEETLCHILGFKFHFYQQTQDSFTPVSLYHVSALLLSHKLVSLDMLYPHLNPPNAEIVEKYKAELQEARQYNRKLTIATLSEKPPSTENQEREEEKERNEPAAQNQKFGLCEALIKIGDWQSARTLMKSLPPFTAVTHKPLAKCLCQLLSYIIEPLYVKHSGLPSIVTQKRFQPTAFGATINQAAVFEDLPLLVFPLLRELGPHLVCDPILLVKMNRLAKAFMTSSESPDETSEVFGGFLTIYDEVLLPSLSLLPGNCGISEEFWGFIKLLRYEHRYRLYGQWKNEAHVHHARLIRARADILDKSRYIMKRLSKENVKPLGRQIGKLSHSAPGTVFEYILSQIQKYDNFIGPVVDSLKFLTSLSYDVLAYCIIEALANPERERLKTDDTNISTWLQSLANFSGSVLKKYPIDLGGLLHYIANQLKANKSYDLYVLREVIQKMAGIEVSEEITSDQLLAMSGGELLRQEGGCFTQIRNTKKSSGRLMESLTEHDLAIPLCLLMAQQRFGIIFLATDPQADKRHTKLIGKLYDQCQDTLVQFLSFLSLQLSADELTKPLPDISELMSLYRITPDVAFGLWRIVFANAISAKFDDLRKLDKKDKQTNSPNAKVQRYLDAVEYVMNPVMDVIRPLNPSKIWDDVGLQFYTTFWSLAIYDIDVPTSSYEKQILLHKSQQTTMEDNKDLAQSKKKKEKERSTALMDKLEDERKRQDEHVKMVMARLKHEKDSWFLLKSSKHSTITAILQMCLFPRCCFTAIDAIYCAKFIYIMHNLKTPNFSSLICYDRIFSDITWAMTSCTENEAHRYGRFLCAVLDNIMSWHSDKNIYDKECADYPGFVTVFRSPSSHQNAVADHLDYENYRHVVHKWHYSLTRVSVNCLESGDYIQIRNMLIILTKILPHYPKVIKLGTALERRVERVIEEEKEKRQDLYVHALAYSGQLKASKKNWIYDQQFHKKEPDPKAQTKPSATASDGGLIAGADTLLQKVIKQDTAAEVKSEKLESSPVKHTSKGRAKDIATAADDCVASSALHPVKTEVKEKSKEVKDSSFLKDKEKTPKESRSSLEIADKERRRDVGDNRRVHTQTSVEQLEMKQEVKHDKEREKLVLKDDKRLEGRNRQSDIQREVDDVTKDKSSRAASDKSDKGSRGHSRESDRDREYEQMDERSSRSMESHRRNADVSKAGEEREVKRRKVDAASLAMKSSPGFERTDERERDGRLSSRELKESVGDWEKKRDPLREKPDRKRLSSGAPGYKADGEGHEVKRHKVDDGSREKLNKTNGSELREKKKELRQSSRSKERQRIKDDELSRVVAKEEDLPKERLRMKELSDGRREKVRTKADDHKRPKDDDYIIKESRMRLRDSSKDREQMRD